VALLSSTCFLRLRQSIDREAYGGQIRLAASAEIIESPSALPSFEATYGFRLSGNQLLTLSGRNTAATSRAMSGRQGRATQAHAGGIEDGVGEGAATGRIELSPARAGGSSGRLSSTMSIASGASMMSRIG